MTVIEQLLEAGIEYHPAAFLTPVEETVNR
jgi:hypothetical protein